MKKSLFTGGFALLILLALLAPAACKKSSSVTPNPITPLQALVNGDTSMVWFHRLLLAANESILLADDSVTLLIPTNDAFRAAGYNIDSIGSTAAGRLVSYHVIKGRIQPSTPDYSIYSSMLGYNIYGMKDNAGAVLFNGVPVSGDSIHAGKAIVYRISAPLSPAFDSIGALLNADSNLTIFHEAFNRSGLDSTLLTGNYTLFAPNNDAFAAAGYTSTADIDAADSLSIVALVKNQLVASIYFVNTLSGIGSVNTVAGNSITVSLSGGVVQLAGSGNTVPANLLGGNYVAGNAFVVHRISQVLR